MAHTDSAKKNLSFEIDLFIRRTYLVLQRIFSGAEIFHFEDIQDHRLRARTNHGLINN
jgi:hypothetical protein